MKKLVLVVVLALTLFSLGVTPVSAVEYGGVGGKPANPRQDNPRSESIFVYELAPGESVRDGVELFNNSTETKTIAIGAVDSTLASDGAFACAQEAEEKISVGTWISLDRTRVTLEPGDSTVVPFRVTVPENASVGEQSGCITIQDTQQSTNPEQTGVVVTFRSAIRLSVTVPGSLVKSLAFESVTLQPNPALAGTYSIQPTLRNSGNVSLDTELDVRLLSLFGTASTQDTANYPVLPGTSARWNFEVDAPFWGGFYQASVTATYNDNAQDSLGESSSGTKAATTERSGFVFIPPHPIAAAIELLVLVLFIAVLFLLLRNLYLRRIVAKKWSPYTVKEHDTIQSIAQAHGTSWKRLAKANAIKAPYQITPGQTLKAPQKKR